MNNVNTPLVYLCGTITTEPKYLNWRKDVEKYLLPYGVGCISPVRGKDPKDWRKDGLNAIRPTIYDKGGFVPRDRRDVKRCDAVLLVFVEAPDRQSIGTWTEYGWADMLDKPIVVVSTLPEVIEHPFIWKSAARVCAAIEEGQDYIRFLLQKGSVE